MPQRKDQPQSRGTPLVESSQDAPFREIANAVPPEELRPPDPDSPRGRILGAARRLFAEYGFDGTSTRAVAESAGVNLAMIHYYYGNKDQLYERVIAGEIVSIRQGVLSTIPEDAAPEEALVTVPLRMMNVLHADPVRASLLRREIASGGRYAIRAIQGLGEHGPLGIAQVFERVYAAAAQRGLVRDLPPRAVRECLISVAFSAILFSPMLSAVAGRDFNDETVWQEWKETWNTLLRRGLLMEKS